MSKNLTENYPIVDTVEALEERLAGVREAQRIFAAYTQEQVDKIFTAAALECQIYINLVYHFRWFLQCKKQESTKTDIYLFILH